MNGIDSYWVHITNPLHAIYLFFQDMCDLESPPTNEDPVERRKYISLAAALFLLLLLALLFVTQKVCFIGWRRGIMELSAERDFARSQPGGVPANSPPTVRRQPADSPPTQRWK